MDFSRYATSCFNPFLFSAAAHAKSGCGASALGLLTGIPPANFAAKRPDQHYPDEFMLRCLRRHGFQLMRLTQCIMSQNTSLNMAGINARHVLLVSQLVRENEGSWLVIFDSLCFHQYDVYSLAALSFINKPLLSAYLVCHRNWQRNSSPPAKPLRKPPATRGGISWAAIHDAGLTNRKRIAT